MKRKFFVLIVFLIALIFNVFANGCALNNKNGFYFELSDNKDFYTVIRYENSLSDEIIIPKEFKNKPVKKIASQVFENNDNIKKVLFESESNIEIIEKGAFSSCSNLESIKLPNSIVSIEADAFSDCSNLESIELPDSIISIGAGAFSDCSKLKEVDFNNNIKITKLEPFFFYNCQSLEEIEIPSSINTIEKRAFANCYNLKKVNFNSYNKLNKIGNLTFENCENLTSIVIPTTVSQIDTQAFYGCYKLVEIYNLSSLNIAIGSSNNGMVGINALDIYDNLDEVSKLTVDDNGCIIHTANIKTLIGCYNNESVLNVPSGINVINNYAFYNLYRRLNLKTVNLPISLTKIGDYAFYNCKVKFNYLGTTSQWDNIKKGTSWNYIRQTTNVIGGVTG